MNHGEGDVDDTNAQVLLQMKDDEEADEMQMFYGEQQQFKMIISSLNSGTKNTKIHTQKGESLHRKVMIQLPKNEVHQNPIWA